MIAAELRSQRLQYYPIEQADRSALLRLWSSPDVTRYINLEPLEYLAQVERMIKFFIHQADEGSGRRYALYFGGQLIGTCGYNRYDAAQGAIEIGYELKASAWGRGFGQEAVMTLVDYAFNTLHCDYVDAVVHCENRRSIALLEKLSFIEMEGSEDLRLAAIEKSRLYRRYNE